MDRACKRMLCCSLTLITATIVSTKMWETCLVFFDDFAFQCKKVVVFFPLGTLLAIGQSANVVFCMLTHQFCSELPFYTKTLKHCRILIKLRAIKNAYVYYDANLKNNETYITL